MARVSLKEIKAISQGIPELTSVIKQFTDSLTAQEEQTKALTEEQKKYNEALEETKLEYQELSDYEKELIQLEKDLKQALANGTDELGRNAETLKEAIIQQRKAVKVVKDLTKAEEDLKKATKEVTDGFSDFGGSLFQAFTGIKTGENSFGRLNKLSQQYTKVKGRGLKVTDLFSKGLSKQALKLKAANLAGAAGIAIFQKFGEATAKAFKDSQELGDELGRQFGLIQETGELDNLLKMAQNSNDANVSFVGLGKAAAELQRATQGMFGNIATARPELALFASEMVGVGVETQTTAELFGKFGKIMGKDSVNEIKKLEKEAVKMARTFGLSADSVIKDITEMSDSLTSFGGNAGKVALEVSQLAGAARISSKGIVGLGKSFEFFPDAINNANELNLVFQRNVIDGQKMFMMMNDGTKGPGEAFRYFLTQIGPALDETFLQSPAKLRGFNQTLSQFGISEAEAAKLARDIVDANKQGKSLTQVLDERQSKISQNAKALKSFSNLTKELTKLQESFAIALGPVVDLLTDMVKAINSIDPETLRVVSAIAGGALVGGAAGAAFGGVGAAPGALIGAALAGVGAAAVNDGVITVSNGQASVTKVNSQDDLKIVAAKPGGPISKMGSSAGAGSAEIVVSLFGEELVRRMVDLVDAEQGKRKEINSIIQGAA